jgi:3-dehydroquinate synthase
VRPLDFGHWAAHKLETLSGYECRHGEAVAIGMALDAYYSAAAGLLDRASVETICSLLERLGFRLWHEDLLRTTACGNPALVEGIAEFRQHIGGDLALTLLTGIGRAVEAHEIDERRVVEAVHWLAQRDISREARRAFG